MGFTRTVILNPGVFSNPVQFADGTVAAPSITFANDPDTGLYSGAANQLYFTSGGTATLKFLGNGITLVSNIGVVWAASTIDSTQDTFIQRSSAGVLKFGNATQSYDNEASLGDATHRLSNVHLRALTLNTSLASATSGVVTLSGAAGSAIIYNSAITATTTSVIIISKLKGSGTQGSIAITTSASGQATVASTSTTDTSTVFYWVLPTS